MCKAELYHLELHPKLMPAGRWFLSLIALLICCGCSGGVHSRFVEVEMHLASPYFGEYMKVPVVYPGGPVIRDKQMMHDYGSSWRGLEYDYPAYNFNP